MANLLIEPPTHCDICKQAITNKFYDSKVLYAHTWAIMCHPCYHQVGSIPGLGMCQEYTLVEPHRWAKTGG